LDGAGVYYYAPMTEALSYKNEDVYIVGAANSAGQAAMYFPSTRGASTMLVRGESLSAGMSQYLEDQLAATKNIVVKLNTCVVDVKGNGRCESITLMNTKTCVGKPPPPARSSFTSARFLTRIGLNGVVERDAKDYRFRDALVAGRETAKRLDA